jgi:polyphosphate kinase
MNALEDGDVVRSLYEAAKVGVKIDLIVRDSCRIRPGIPGISETVTVLSIIGRFLEHARIVYFRNGGEEEYYLGSADIMRRNLEKRVEVLIPATDRVIKAELRKILDVQFADRENAWRMRSDGSYEKVLPGMDSDAKNSQDVLMDIAEKRRKVAAKLKKLHSHGKSKKEYWTGH